MNEDASKLDNTTTDEVVNNSNDEQSAAAQASAEQVSAAQNEQTQQAAAEQEQQSASQPAAEPAQQSDTPALPTKENRGAIVVGVGASAGGLEVLQQFFSAMPRVSGCSFVVVQHLSPDHKSMLPEILGKQTKMPVLQARNGMRILANHVYLIPPRNNIEIHEDRLVLKEYDTSKVNHPIDVFFNSLAEEKHERCVAVVLSGTGSDGTRGIKAIKEAGGLVIVQDPTTAKFDGMPRSAIGTGLADFILPPHKIVDEILNFSQHPTLLDAHDGVELYNDDEAMLRIYSILKQVCKIDFTHYKRSTVVRRIERRMVVTHSTSLSDFATLLELDDHEARALGREILIGVTRFFRDEDAFQELKYKVIYNIISRATEKDVIRVWVAGCSTGEEAYSIAILFREAMEEQNVRRQVKIFATDVDAESVEIASKGIYPESIADDISSERLMRFFEIRGDTYHVSKDIRKMIVFAPHNVFTDPPFGKLDLISCRNVMIYFQHVLQKMLFSIFHSALKDGGYLFLGKSETANDVSDVFVPVSSVERIYAHVGEGKMPDSLTTAYTVQAPLNPTTATMIARESREENDQIEKLYTGYLERFLPPSVVIDESNQAVHFFGDYNLYLSISPGKASFSIFNLVHEDLSLAASTAISRCRSEEAAVTYTDIAVRTSEGVHHVDMTVQPLWEIDPALSGMIALVFADHTQTAPEAEISERYDIEKTAARRISYLENELQSTQNDLKASISDLETVNEELQAANEELLTTNEELQASNEELYTVNAEYEQKLDELASTTNDLTNFLSSTMIGIIFLDNKLNIRKFTEYVGREFEIMSHDIGRSIQIIEHRFANINLVEDAQQVLKSLMPIDKEVRTVDGKNYTLRIAPYRTTENSIEGLVLTIIDSIGAE